MSVEILGFGRFRTRAGLLAKMPTSSSARSVATLMKNLARRFLAFLSDHVMPGQSVSQNKLSFLQRWGVEIADGGDDFARSTALSLEGDPALLFCPRGSQPRHALSLATAAPHMTIGSQVAGSPAVCQKLTR